jgi:aryl-alcohol dehydrogenase-like predicted oxidoreductase
MEKRRLGRTNHLSSVVIFGAAAFSNVSQEQANDSLDLALAHGVNHLDVAPAYGQAEERIGPWLESRRDQFFLGCKTLERSREGAWTQLRRSLEKLHTDQFELYQLHAVTSSEELDQALSPGGAIEALMQAREQGLTRWLGITGHGIHTPAIFAAALERFDFDTVMYPIHPRLYADPQYRRDSERLLQMAADRDVGVMIIKSITRAAWGTQTQNYNTWYQPYDTQKEIESGVRFALSQPGVAGIPSAADVRLLPMVLEAAEHFTPMSQDEQETLIEQSRELDPMFYEGQKF